MAEDPAKRPVPSGSGDGLYLRALEDPTKNIRFARAHPRCHEGLLLRLQCPCVFTESQTELCADPHRRAQEVDRKGFHHMPVGYRYFDG